MNRAMPVPEFTRRQSLIAGGLSLLGLTSAELSAMRAASAHPVPQPSIVPIRASSSFSSAVPVTSTYGT